MTLLKKLALLAGSAICFVSTAAHAGVVEELRLGLAKHDVELTGDPTREDGMNVQPQIVFSSPGFLRVVGSPNPYLIASINTAGDTNFGGAGLLYKRKFGNSPWFWEIDGGIVVHDGRTDLPPPQFAEERLRILSSEITFGSKEQFHFVAGLGTEVSENWDLQFYFEHLSHGQILSTDTKNEGVENLGIKVGHRFW